MGTSDKSGDSPNPHAHTVASSPDARVDSSPLDLHAGDKFVGRLVADRYQVLSLLGKGGMGSVYVSEHVQLKKRVALKVLSEEFRGQPELVTRFLKEARAAAQIGHPNIIDVFDLGELPEGGAFIAMALLEGEDLQSELERVGVMPVPRARRVVGEICRALAAAHSKGIVHRDMKPANVFLAQSSDGGEQVKVLDFGIAQIQEPTGEAARLTQTGAIVGTPAFMSPEQGRGDRADHRADIYAVGCILYNLITGYLPFESGTLMGVISKHLFEPVVPPSQRRPDAGIGPDLDAVVLRAMEKDPAHRFQTMKEMWSELATQSASDGTETWPDANSGRYMKLGTPMPSTLRSAVGPRRASPVPIWVGLVVLLVALGGGGLVLWQRTKSQPVVAPTTPPVPALPPDVTIDVRSTPSGAIVRDGEQQIGTTPLHLVRPRSNAALSLRVSAEGYEATAVDVGLDRDHLVELPLRVVLPAPVPPPVRPKPSTPVAHTPRPTTPTTKPQPAVKVTGHDGKLKDPFAQ